MMISSRRLCLAFLRRARRLGRLGPPTCGSGVRLGGVTTLDPHFFHLTSNTEIPQGALQRPDHSERGYEDRGPESGIEGAGRTIDATHWEFKLRPGRSVP